MPFRSGLRRLALLGGLLVLTPAVISGCASSGNTAAESAQEAYDRGMRDYERRRFDTAAEHFRAALDFGRGTAVARDAQMQLARSYYENHDYLLAGQEFTRFIELYTDDPRTIDAEYERMTAYYRLSPSYELDPTDTETAIRYIENFVSRHPENEHATEALAMQEELREKLAHKRFEAGRLYERRDLYEASVITYRSVLVDFPTSPWADDAMLGQLRAQVRFAEESIPDRQVVRFTEALTVYDRLVELFPTSPLLPEAQTYYDRAYAGRRAAEARPVIMRAPAPTATGAQRAGTPSDGR